VEIERVEADFGVDEVDDVLAEGGEAEAETAAVDADTETPSEN